jgi:hypothetical protein
MFSKVGAQKGAVERENEKTYNRFLSENAVIKIRVFREIHGSNGVE